MTEKNFTLLREPWNSCEKVIISIAEKRLDKIKNKLKKSKIENILGFLQDIGFFKDGELTQNGREYYKIKYVLGDGERARIFLTEILKQYPPVQMICQILWGRNNLSRENIYRLLIFEGVINNEVKPTDLGSFLMLLNTHQIVKYSKQKNKVTILYNPRTDTNIEKNNRFLSPETPYTNIKNLWDVLRECKEYIYWFDKHFSKKGFEPLSEEADANKIKEIKILAGPANINETLKRDFERFQTEMRKRGIKTEFRVILDKDILNEIHDRWIISKDICYNIPPINTIYQGQYAEIKKTENIPPFNDWWLKGLDILKDWQTIISRKPVK